MPMQPLPAMVAAPRSESPFMQPPLPQAAYHPMVPPSAAPAGMPHVPQPQMPFFQQQAAPSVPVIQSAAPAFNTPPPMESNNPAPTSSYGSPSAHAASSGHDAQISSATNRAIAKVAKADGENFAAQNPARFLLVEDQPLNQKISTMLLQRLGYGKVDIANNGQEAVEKVGQGTYDIVFMDLQMPVMGGIDATRAIRGNFQLKHQPAIIAMTGHALTGVKEECREVGMNAFLTKPVSLDDFRRVIPPALAVEASKVPMSL